jgi:cytochrome b561
MREAYDRYSGVSILLHWLIAGLVVANILIAFAMEDNHGLFPWHKSIGIAVLLLTLARIGWRAAHPWPPFPERMAAWERGFARFTHIAFYVLLLAVPLLGWATVSAGRGIGELFGFLPWFDLPVARSRDLSESFGEAHETAVWLTLVLVACHVAGALKHHLVDRDVVLHRMLPPAGRRDRVQGSVQRS